MKTQLSKPYPHHERWRVRVRTPDGWRWAPSADTPEEAVEAAKSALAAPDPGGKPEPPPAQKVEPAAAPAHRTSVEGVRLDGPHAHRAGYRYRLVSSTGRQWAPVGGTEAQALRIAQRLAKTLASEGSLSVEDVLAAFLEAKRQDGARASTLGGYRSRCEAFFGGQMSMPIGRLTAHRAQDLYERVRQATHRGRPTSVATHRSTLRMAKSMLAWAAEKGWIRESPVAGLKGIGVTPRGKPQLTIDEGRLLYAHCLRRAGEGDVGAAAALMALGLGMRASEIVSRTARDLDDQGRVLRVEDNQEAAFKLKSRSSRRVLSIPEVLRPILARCALGKMPGDRLFTSAGRRQHGRKWVWVRVRRLCQEAGVPAVCPHGLRGVSATAAAAAGALPELVASMLGHSSPTMTTQHYIKTGTVEASQIERGNARLTDPKK